MAQAAKPPLNAMNLQGCRIGKYDVEEMLGEGGMAVVYRAIHRDFEMPVALKILLQEYTKEVRILRRFREEARILFQLRHPHLVRVLEILEEGPIVGMVMDYVQGTDLSKAIQARISPFSFEEIQQIFLPVLGAVGYAHKAGIVHRDLKPSNLLLGTREGRLFPYVTDFGVAKALDDRGRTSLTKPGTLLGTPHYCSPEQIQSSPSLDHRTDIYSLGCTLYELFALHPPFFHKANLLEILFSHSFEPFPSLLPRYPREGFALDGLFEKACAKPREARFHSCETFASALSFLLSSFASGSSDVLEPAFEKIHTQANEASGTISTSNVRRAPGKKAFLGFPPLKIREDIFEAVADGWTRIQGQGVLSPPPRGENLEGEPTMEEPPPLRRKSEVKKREDSKSPLLDRSDTLRDPPKRSGEELLSTSASGRFETYPVGSYDFSTHLAPVEDSHSNALKNKGGPSFSPSSLWSPPLSALPHGSVRQKLYRVSLLLSLLLFLTLVFAVFARRSCTPKLPPSPRSEAPPSDRPLRPQKRDASVARGQTMRGSREHRSLAGGWGQSPPPTKQRTRRTFETCRLRGTKGRADLDRSRYLKRFLFLLEVFL